MTYLGQLFTHTMLHRTSKKVREDERISSVSRSLKNDFPSMTRRGSELQFGSFTYTCPICLEERDDIFICVRFDCGHSACKECFEAYAMNMIDHGDVTRLQCPECPAEDPYREEVKITPKNSSNTQMPKFDVKMPVDKLYLVLPESYVSKYERLLHQLQFQRYHAQNPDHCFCCERCGKWSLRKDVSAERCCRDHRLYLFCFLCKKQWHGYNSPNCTAGKKPTKADVEKFMDPKVSRKEKTTLTQYFGQNVMDAAMKRINDEQDFDKLVRSDATLVRWLRCTITITKAWGCNKMICTQCHQHLCFLCGCKLSSADPYRHFSDPQSSCYMKVNLGVVARRL